MDIFRTLLSNYPSESSNLNAKLLDQSRVINFAETSSSEDAQSQQATFKLFIKKGFFQPKATMKARPVMKNQPAQKQQYKKAYREPTITVKGNWEMLLDLVKSNMDKLKYDPGAPQLLSQHLRLFKFRKNYGNKPFKPPIKLETDKNIIHTLSLGSRTTTSEDPIMEKFKDVGNVFITDSILSTIMTMMRSVYPWHVFITKKDGRIIFNKEQASSIDLPTVNETAGEQMPDEEEPETSQNHSRRLAEEADRVNKAFMIRFRADNSTYTEGEPHPFEDKHNAREGFKYLLYTFGEDTKVVVRATVDMCTEKEDTIQLLKVCSLHEYDARISGGFANKVQREPGQLMGKEFGKNTCKMSKIMIEATIAGCENMHIGFVSREQNSSYKHVIHYVKIVKVEDTFQQVNLNLYNGWGIFRHILETVKANPDGKYVLMKDTYKNTAKLYAMVEDREEEEDKF